MNTLDEREKLSARVEGVYEGVIANRRAMHAALEVMESHEDAAKLAHAEEWGAAKNNDVRRVMLMQWLEEDGSYQGARADYRHAKLNFRVGLIDAERLKLLIKLETGHDTR